MYTSGLYHKSEVNMTKKLIDRLEELADEMKVIVHQLRVPSTVTQEEISKAEWQRGEVEGVIEFEGKQYRKVDRMAREGDVVVFKSENIHYRKNKPYLVLEDNEFTDEDGDLVSVYNAHKRTPEAVDVYELMDGYNPQIPILEESNVKSPNQQRAEVIEKAKKFVESITNGGEYVVPFDEGEGQWFLRDFDFVVNEPKRTIVALCKSIKGKVLKRSIAKCMPTDVFNEHIGKAIALGRALGLDVSEFENAVQPNEIVSGMYCKHRLPNYEGKVTHFDGSQWRGEKGIDGSAPHNLTIINDTNAKYSEVNA